MAWISNLFEIIPNHDIQDLLNALIEQRLTFVVLLGLVLSLFFCSLLRRGKNTLKADKPLQALLTVLTPTRSTWPSAYSALADCANSSGGNTINIPLFQLLKDVYAGVLEFRDPRNDLPDLFRDRIRTYGWLIRLDIGVPCWVAALRWLSSSTFPAFKPEIRLFEKQSVSDARKSNIRSTSHQLLINGAKVVFQDSRLVPFPALPLCSENTGSVLYLDFLHHGHLETVIRTLQSTLLPGNSFTLEFTTLGPSVMFLSTKFILCALPFLPRLHVRTQKEFLYRTSTPLLTSLHRVIELATTGPSPLIVTNVRNVSEEHVVVFDSILRELEVDRQVRSSFIDKWGMECWREHRFLTAWECGLLSAGYLMRWIVVVRKHKT